MGALWASLQVSESGVACVYVDHRRDVESASAACGDDVHDDATRDVTALPLSLSRDHQKSDFDAS